MLISSKDTVTHFTLTTHDDLNCRNQTPMAATTETDLVQDTDKRKINLGVGAYRTEQGRLHPPTPTFI